MPPARSKRASAPTRPGARFIIRLTPWLAGFPQYKQSFPEEFFIIASILLVIAFFVYFA
jgi:hypothetical protein